MTRLLAIAAILALTIAGCSPATPERTWPQRRPVPAPDLLPPDEPGALRVLFLGNSLTGANSVPKLVQALAKAGGVSLNAYGRIYGDYAIEDHWVIADSRDILADSRWDFVVLQQGPSTRPESQANLKEWSIKWADFARAHKVTPALYMVWPFQQQGAKGFQLAAQSYRAAAEASQSRILPAGEAWAEALKIDPNLGLFTADGLHPTQAGSYLAALVITHGLSGVRPAKAPARLELGEGVTFEIPEAQAAMLRTAAEKIAGPAK